MPRGFISTTAADKRDLIIYFTHSPVKKVFDAEIRVLEKFAADWARGERTQEVAPDDPEILVADIENDDLGYDVSVIPDLKGSESIVFSERFVIDSNKVCDDASAARTARGSAPGGSPKATREEV
ncbi:hypothetical protein E4U28_007770 [Claviceps purpurea]|nr:hypothetical protein E4U28_007770 [Claviceps purpurea]